MILVFFLWRLLLRASSWSLRIQGNSWQRVIHFNGRSQVSVDGRIRFIQWGKCTITIWKPDQVIILFSDVLSCLWFSQVMASTNRTSARIRTWPPWTWTVARTFSSSPATACGTSCPPWQPQPPSSSRSSQTKVSYWKTVLPEVHAFDRGIGIAPLWLLLGRWKRKIRMVTLCIFKASKNHKLDHMDWS